ncbi:MAG: hypothetical protein SPL89_04400 [Clostridia bacterium]|nr:hypothetical protein [Clostridia bacterium]
MDNKDSAGLRLKIKSGAAANKKASVKWIVSIFVWTFVLSITMSVVSSAVLEELNIVFAFLILIVIVSIGIVFDMIGIAVTTADETPFHALASKKYKSAACSIKLIRNAEKVSSFCNDVVGDIAGIVSGSTLAVIVAHIFSEGNSAVSVVMTGILSAVTVGGKAIGKTMAMKNANKIVHIASVIIYSFSRKKK